MTREEKRRAAILKAIEDYTAKHTVSKEAARAAMVREGFCYEDGSLRPEYGGEARES